MKISALATLLIAATAAHAADTKQNIRKAVDAQGDGYSYTPPTCSVADFPNPGVTLVQVGQICTVVPNLPNQPGAPQGTVDGIFCTDTGSNETDTIGEYTLEFDADGPEAVTGGTGNILRATLNIPTLTQFPAPGENRRLQEFNPLLDPAVNGGLGAPTDIQFQGFFDNYCNFKLVSTQGGQLTGTLNPNSPTQAVSVQFTQSGQVTSPLNSLPGQFQDDNVVGLFVSNFAFAFQGNFEVEPESHTGSTQY